MTSLTRRELLRGGGQAAAVAALAPLVPRWWRPHPALADFGAGPVPAPPIEDPDVKALALRAVEAARTAGAHYADVRFTHTHLWAGVPANNKQETMHVGARALVNGYWGFAASPVWSPDEMARLGKEAVHQAKTNALGKERVVDLAPTPKVVDGHWTMPVKIDPFLTDPGEIQDVLETLKMYMGRYRWRRRPEVILPRRNATFVRQEKAFASTEGSYCTQRLYWSWGVFEITAQRGGVDLAQGGFDFLSPSGIGWELYRERDLRAEVWQLLEALDEDTRLPTVPVEVGRYDTALDARAVAALLDATLGRATELDRALGYEANTTGTSYLNDPMGMVGSYQAGAEALTVTANRTEPGGCATVQWDDEGVVPDAFPLIKDGVLQDFHTTRESAGWMKDYYTKQQRPVRSHGCANTSTAREAPLTHTPNLVVTPGTEARDFDELVTTIKGGIAYKSWGYDMVVDIDYQCLNGLAVEPLPLQGSGTFYRVKDGRRVAKLQPETAGLLFRSPELWKGLLALGGPASARRYGRRMTKGEPPQTTLHSVTVPPALFKQLTLIDVTRKA